MNRQETGKMDTLGMTSRWVAAARERESCRADRLFDDPFAGALAGDEGRAMMATMEKGMFGPGTDVKPEDGNPYLSIRTRFLDDALSAAVNGGLRQVVILAAGVDARAFRLPWPAETALFEVDRPEVLAYKEKILAGIRATPKTTRKTVLADLRDDFGAALRQAGFVPTKPAAFLVEGLLIYLPDEAAVLSILEKVSALAAPGSFLALDVAGRGFLQSPWLKELCARLAAVNAPWQFGTDDPESLLSRAGFSQIQVSEPGQVGHGRWPYPLVPRSIPGVPRTYLITARKD